MTAEDLTRPLGLEAKHYEMKDLQVPVIDSHLYTTLGRRVFDLYEKYKIETSDQRELERLSYLLITFTLQRGKSPSLWSKLLARMRR